MGHTDSAARTEDGLTGPVREMVLGSPRLTAFAGGRDGVARMLEGIENVWLDLDGARLHLDLHRSEEPRATVVFQPGSGAHARVYFLLGGLLARVGYSVLAVDRPGHGLSEGATGDCTIEEAIGASAVAIDYARRELGLPVVLMGSSMGGLLTVFGLLSGLEPDLAVAHNFVFPGKLFSMRLRSRWIARRRTAPYPLTELVRGFEDLSDDPAVAKYLRERTDPGAAWELSARSVASMFGFSAPAPASAPETLVVTGDRDRAIPAWATRLFTWWSGLPHYEVRIFPGAGHLLFHDHLDVSVPSIASWLDARLPGSAKARDEGRAARPDAVPCPPREESRVPDVETELRSLVGPVLASVADDRRPLVVAIAERVAAERYRGFARLVNDADVRSLLLACADREEEIAGLVEAEVPGAAAVRASVESEHADLPLRYAALFEKHPLPMQLEMQAAAERVGAETWRSFAASSAPSLRDVFLRCALLEEQSAEVLESLLADGRVA